MKWVNRGSIHLEDGLRMQMTFTAGRPDGTSFLLRVVAESDQKTKCRASAWLGGLCVGRAHFETLTQAAAWAIGWETPEWKLDQLHQSGS